MKFIKILLIFSLISSYNLNLVAHSNNTKFTLRQNSNDSILLTWEHKDIPSSQEVYLYSNDGLLIKKLNLLSTITSAIFRNLSPGKAYKIIYKSKDPDIEIIRNIFLYTPPTNINKLTYEIDNDKIIFSWQPKKNNDIVEFRLFADDILKKTHSVAAASNGFIINKPNFEKSLYIEYNTKNDIGSSNKSKIQILSQIIQSLSILSKSEKEIKLIINAKENIEFIIEIYKDETFLNKFTQKENVITFPISDSKYKIITTPILLDGKEGEKFVYHYDNTNNTNSNKEVNTDNKSDKVDIINDKNPTIDKEKQEKNKIDIIEDVNSSILDITKYKVIRITEINYENNKLNLSWLDPFEQIYVIYSKNSKEKNWKNIGETKLKNIDLNINLAKGVNQFKVVGFVDGIKLTESSSRYIFIKN
jgi:hypothetical protein